MPRAIVFSDGSAEAYAVACFHLMLGLETIVVGDGVCYDMLRGSSGVLGSFIREPSSLALLRVPSGELLEAVAAHVGEGYPLIVRRDVALGLGGSVEGLDFLASLAGEFEGPVPVRVRGGVVVYRDCRALYLALREYRRLLEKSGLLATTPSIEYLRLVGGSAGDSRGSR